MGGVWGTVCDYLGEWGPENAAVVCGQLGLPTESKSILTLSIVCVYWVSDFACFYKH